MKISIVVAKGRNGQIGKDNQLLWRIRDDLQNFKKLTTNHHILMGRNTFESIGKPLPNRINMIITRNMNFMVPANCFVFDCPHKATDFARKNGENELFVCGGSLIYDFFLENNLVDKMYVTNVDYDGEADRFFPEIDCKKWEIVGEKIIFEKNQYNEYGGEIVVLERHGR